MSAPPVFADVADTPMFKARVVELESTIKNLKDRSSSFYTASNKYRNVVEATHNANIGFASALHDFCGSSDGESLDLGGVVMSQFVKAFRDIAGCHDLLRTQVDVSLCAYLQEAWLDGFLATAREDIRKYDKKSAEHESARMKYLALKRVTKKEVLERAQADMLNTKAAADTARLELARNLTCLESRKRYAFLEALVSVMHSHLKFFQNGFDVLRKLEPVLHQAQEIVEHMRDEEKARATDLEESIRRHTEATAQREALLQQLQQQGISETTSDSPGLQGAGVQMAASKAALLAEIEGYIRATQASGSSQVTVIKSGYLQKRSQKSRNDYKRRFFVLDSQGMLYYYSHRDSLLSLTHKASKPKNTVSLITSTVKLDDEEHTLRFAFRVVSPEGTYTLQAENELERSEWVDALQGVIGSLINGAAGPSAAQVPRVPQRPTHSRHNSMGEEAFQGSPLGGVLGRDPFHGPDGNMSPTGSFVRNNAPRSSRSHSGSSHQNVQPLERLRRPVGNRQCADCANMDPDWASLNLGILLCIECSGIHRQLGVHISKVRSCTLDVKVWDGPIMDVFEAIGNEYSNTCWEAALPAPPGPATAPAAPAGGAAGGGAASSSDAASMTKADSWVWCDDDDDELEVVPKPGGPRTSQLGAAPRRPEVVLEDEVLLVPAPSLPQPGPVKPGLGAPLSSKQRFIVDKYVQKAYAVPMAKEAAQVMLWDGAAASDIRMALRALSSGADITAAYRTPRAQRLLRETMQRATRAVDVPVDEPVVCGELTVLHLAARVGQPAMLEFLLQNGAPLEPHDSNNRSPLHYAVVWDHSDCAKLLLKRGADVMCKDNAGNTAWDLALIKGRVSDEELFVLLSSPR